MFNIQVKPPAAGNCFHCMDFTITLTVLTSTSIEVYRYVLLLIIAFDQSAREKLLRFARKHEREDTRLNAYFHSKFI